ncbi:unnamed protein product [Arctia plantaginis]|uniref:Uncharacterized protein n=1 Tax=Arctia plantaginis TaxID=874455 RepID=A0A8S0ZS17_ARCPL|nr:unnamed protein product [Arctia plantaginis]
MAPSGDLLLLVHNVSSISVDFKGPMATSQELRSRSLESCRTSMKSVVLIPTAMNQGDMVKDPKLKHTEATIEPGPVAENDNDRLNQYRNMKFRREIHNFRNHPCVLNCNQNQCPALKERLEHHRCANYRHRAKTNATKKYRDQGINVSPAWSELTLPQITMPMVSDGKAIQTEITLEDFILQNESITDTLNYLKDLSQNGSNSREEIPKIMFYKEHLQNEILDWLQNVPIFYTLDFTVDYLRDNIVSVFVDRIARLVPLMHEESYAASVKAEIDDCLNILPIWLPNCHQEQIQFKNSLRDKLYYKIEKLNENIDKPDFNINDENFTESQEKELADFTSLYVKVVNSWLHKIKFNKLISRKHVIDVMMERILPLLNEPLHVSLCKTNLKSRILDILDDLPINLLSAKNRNVHLNRFSEDLANRLLSARAKLESPEKYVDEKLSAHMTGTTIYNKQLKQTVHDTVTKALGKTMAITKCNVERELRDVILNCLDALRSGIENNVSNEICDVLRRTCNITEERAMKFAKKIKLYIKIALKHEKGIKETSFHSIQPRLSGTMSIYRSSESFPITSTPKKPVKKDTPRLNPEEIAYMKQVADLVRAWMQVLPKNFDDDVEYKDTIINDIAGDIMDEVKRQQLSPEVDTEKDKHIHYFMYRWLSRFEVFDDLNDAKPLIENFLIKLKQIPEPQLTAPQHGTRQAMRNLKHLEAENGWEEECIPTGIDILEDQISVWMNEQPPEIYTSDNRKTRAKHIKDLALKLQDHLRNKHSEDEITEEINQWLKQIVKSQEKEHLGLLTQYLKDKIINIPQDETLDARNQKRKRQKAEYRQNVTSTASPAADDAVSLQEYPEETMKEFILKYVEHNYDIDDPMAKGAFCQLLKTELRKLSPSTRQELYDNFPTTELFTSEKFANELEYISMISDWLKNIPINPLYNTAGNRARVDFVNDLARNIQEAEEQRKEYLDGMDYDLFLSSVISISLRTYNLPILPEHKDNIPLMINQLLSKIIAKRSLINQQELATNKVTEKNLSEFIDQFILINNREINDDEVKREAWTARLVKEVNKILHEETDLSKLTKTQVYEKLSQVPIPGKASVRRFSLEMAYVKEIADWLNNLPLLSITDLPEAEKERINMISELAERISERETKKSSDPNDNTAEKNLVAYITNWISKLPLDPRKNLVVPILIQQLMNRIEKINRKDITLPDDSCEVDESSSIKSDTVINNDKDIRDPGTHIVDSIEAWCNRLPIEGNDQDFIKNMKQEIARKLYQKIGELNVNPRIYNDDILYKSLLEDEIDTILENLPQNTELQNKRNDLKSELLNIILEMKSIIAKNLAGDNYKHKLETTIDAAIPNPVQNRQIIEPGFEIYKKHLANMFILDNFDHSDDEIKNKYEKRIREEVDKYFESALKRNALPMTRAQMYNELYSELFKVPMPSENSVVDQVEEVKTRCEVDAWFDDLPLREASGISEYLEWDQILSTLAKRIHDIEKYEANSEEKIRKEISKWLQKLPLLTRQQSNIDHYINKLQNTLESSAEARKYVAANPKEAINTVKKNRPDLLPKVDQETEPVAEGKRCNFAATSYKRPGDLIVEIVENWCDEIELIGDEVQNKLIKDNLSTIIVMEICKLNMDVRILNDDIVYDQLLDEKLEKCMSDLPTSHNFQQSKSEKKQQLIEMIRLIKPQVKEGNKKHEYKTELNDTITSILNDHNETAEKLLEFNKLKEDIIDNFVQFNYNQDDDEAKEIYKRNLHEAVVKYLEGVKDKGKQLDPLIQRNQLLCELLKIPVPNNSLLKDEVDEIKMKQEIEQFFEENSLNDNTVKTTQTKKVLAKRLNDIEKSGHDDFNDEKMKSEISKCLNKLDKEVNPEVIEEFVKVLKNNEAERKRPPKNDNQDKFTPGYRSAGPINGSMPTPQTPLFHPGNSYPENSLTPQVGSHKQGQFLQVPPLLDQSHCRSNQQWISLEPATPRKDDVYYEPSNVREFGIDLGKMSNCRDMIQHQPENYGGRENGAHQNSFLSPQGYKRIPISKNNVGLGQKVASSPPLEPAQNYSVPFQHGADVKSDRSPPRNFRCSNQNRIRSPLQQSQNNGNYKPSSNQPVNYPQPAQYNQNQPLNYNEFMRRYGVSEKRGDVSQTSLKGHYNSNTIRPYAPSVSDQRSISEATSYRKVATPRQIQSEAHEYELCPPQDVSPDSLFQSPVTAPRRLSSLLTVLSGNPSCSSRGLRPSLRPSGRSSPFYCPTTGTKRSSRICDTSDVLKPCVCDSRKRCKPGSYCMVPVEEYCEECGGFTPTWCRMPIRGCFFMHCF